MADSPPSLDRFVFDWLNERQPDLVAEAIEEYDKIHVRHLRELAQ